MTANRLGDAAPCDAIFAQRLDSPQVLAYGRFHVVDKNGLAGQRHSYQPPSVSSRFVRSEPWANAQRLMSWQDAHWIQEVALSSERKDL